MRGNHCARHRRAIVNVGCNSVGVARMTVGSFLEVSLFVADVDRSATFYEAIGIELFNDDEPGYVRNFEGVIADTTVQLFQSSERRPITHVQLGFRVSDLAAAVRRLDDLGVEWQSAISDYVITKDPDGNIVSLVQEER